MSVVSARPPMGPATTAAAMSGYKAPCLVRWLDANKVESTNPALRRHAGQQQLLMDLAEEIGKASVTPGFQPVHDTTTTVFSAGARSTTAAATITGSSSLSSSSSSEWVDASSANFGRLTSNLGQTATTNQKAALDKFSMQFYDIAAEVRRCSVRSAEQRAHKVTKRQQQQLEVREPTARVNCAATRPCTDSTLLASNNAFVSTVKHAVTYNGLIDHILLKSTTGASQATTARLSSLAIGSSIGGNPSCNVPARPRHAGTNSAHVALVDSESEVSSQCAATAVLPSESHSSVVSHVSASCYYGHGASDATQLPTNAHQQPGPNASASAAAEVDVPDHDCYTFGDGHHDASNVKQSSDDTAAASTRSIGVLPLGSVDLSHTSSNNTANNTSSGDVTNFGSFPQSGSDAGELDLTVDTDTEDESDWLNTDSEDEGITRMLATLNHSISANSVLTQAPPQAVIDNNNNGGASGCNATTTMPDGSIWRDGVAPPPTASSPTLYQSRFSFHPPPFLGGAMSSTQAAPRLLAIPPWRVPVVATRDGIRALSHWLATHIVGRLAYPEPARRSLSTEDWELGGVVNQPAKCRSGAGNFEPEGALPARPATPVAHHRIVDKAPADPFKVLDLHGHGPTIRPHAQLVNIIEHLIAEKEVTPEVIVAAAWFVDGLPIHDVGTDANAVKLQELLRTSNPGESFALERRVTMLCLLIADMWIADQNWSAADWGQACGVSKQQACAMERYALICLHHSISIPPKTWLDHCTTVYSSLAKLRFEPSVNWALLDVCHRMVQTARSSIQCDTINRNAWVEARARLDLLPGVDAIRAVEIDTSAMPIEDKLEDGDDAWLDDVGRDAEGAVAQLVDSDQENIRPSLNDIADDDDEYEEFDGAGSFPMPTFDNYNDNHCDSPVFSFDAPPRPPLQEVPNAFSALALQHKLQVIATEEDSTTWTTGKTIPVVPVDTAARVDFDDDDDCDSDFEEYDGAQRFPMPLLARRNVSHSSDLSDLSAASLVSGVDSPFRPASMMSDDSLLNGFAGLTVTGRRPRNLNGGTTMSRVSSTTSSRLSEVDPNLQQPRAQAPPVVTRAHVARLENQAETVPYRELVPPRTWDSATLINALHVIRRQVAVALPAWRQQHSRPLPVPPVPSPAHVLVPALTRTAAMAGPGSRAHCNWELTGKQLLPHHDAPVTTKRTGFPTATISAATTTTHQQQQPPPGARPPQLRREDRIVGGWQKNDAFGPFPQLETKRSTMPAATTAGATAFFAPPSHGPHNGVPSSSTTLGSGKTAVNSWAAWGASASGSVSTQFPSQYVPINQPAPALDLPPLSDHRSTTSSASERGGGPRTPASMFRVLSWRDDVAASGCERPASVASSIVTVPDSLGCRQNPTVWEYRHALDEALAEEEEEHELTGYPPPSGRVDLPQLQPGTVITLRARHSRMWSAWFDQDWAAPCTGNGCASQQVIALS